ncbi:MAG: acetyl-CoA hydrolase/transferase C-terminal domain-containing protein [Candidatus Caldarchaeum sp.]
MIFDRVKDTDLRNKIKDALTTVRDFFNDGVSVAFSGMAGTAVPKEIPKAIAEISRERGEGLRIRALLVAGTTTNSFEECLSMSNVEARYLIAGGGVMRERVNQGTIEFFDCWLSEYSRLVRHSVIPSGGLDIAVIEATYIDENGNIIPSLSLDCIPAIVSAAKMVIVEVNTQKPALKGIHDIYTPEPRTPIPIRHVGDRVGVPYLRIPKSKISSIVISEAQEEYAAAYQPPTRLEENIARNIIEFLESSEEMKENMVLQAGVGPVASQLVDELPPKHVSVWTEVAPAKWALAIPEKINSMSTACLYTLKGEEKFRDEFYESFDKLFKHIVIRPYEVTNSLEVISRLQVICVQQALEVDLYGNTNVSHIDGKIHNGVGGSGDFTRASHLTIVALPSTAAGGRVSRIVPFTLHTDVVEHDVDVVVTEQGWADLRGLSPRRRASLIIERCAHPDFRDELYKYLTAVKKLEGHAPVDLGAFAQFLQTKASIKKH